MTNHDRDDFRYFNVSLQSELFKRLLAEDAVLVTVQSTRGSVPREAGTWMAVFANGILATVGGGHLEFDAITHARHLLQGHAAHAVVRYALGPSLGQCCGGEVVLSFEPVRAGDVERLRHRLAEHRIPVALFGGGHVGRAVVQVLSTLPVALTWIDSRDEIFPSA